MDRLFLSSYNDINVGLKLSLAIMLHNIPEGIAIAVPIYYATNNKKKALNKTLISGLSEPIGALMAYLILFKYINNQIISIILLFVAGIMISISIHKMLPVTLKYNCNKYIYIGSNSNTIKSTSLKEDQIAITTKGNKITVENLTDKNINKVYVYYKTVSTGNCYLGGVTYRLKLQNVRSGKSVSAESRHFSNLSSEIIKVETAK